MPLQPSRLTKISDTFYKHTYGQKRKYVTCQCECGNVVDVRTDALDTKKKSCGCLNKDKNKTVRAGYKRLDYDQIYNLCEQGLTNIEIAEKCDTSACVVYKILRNQFGILNPNHQPRELKPKYGADNPSWTGYKQVPGDYWTQVQRGKTLRDLEFSITIEYIADLLEEQENKCALTGLPIQFNTRFRHTASLDRIDSNKGYVPGNVQWIDKRINKLKMDLPEEEFKELCLLIVQHDPSLREQILPSTEKP